jgi:hypothetical protein
MVKQNNSLGAPATDFTLPLPHVTTWYAIPAASAGATATAAMSVSDTCRSTSARLLRFDFTTSPLRSAVGIVYTANAERPLLKKKKKKKKKMKTGCIQFINQHVNRHQQKKKKSTPKHHPKYGASPIPTCRAPQRPRQRRRPRPRAHVRAAPQRRRPCGRRP